MKKLLTTLSLLLCLVCAGLARADSSADVSAVLSTTAVHAGDTPTIAVIVKVHDGLHAQSHTPVDDYAVKFDLATDKNPQADFGATRFPDPTIKTFPNLGKLSVYEGKNVIRVPVTIHGDAKTGDLKLSGSVTFQACNDDTCFPPETVNFSVDTKVVAAGDAVTPNADYPADKNPPTTLPAAAPAAPTPPNAKAQAGTSTNTQASDTIFGFDPSKASTPIVFLAAFLVGIIFNLMPCVLPVLPLKIMGFYEVSQHDRRKSLMLGAVFSAGLIASFAVLAVLVFGSAKLNWGGLFEQTWFTVTISGVLLAMAISTFGFFTINVPTALYSFTPRHDTYVGNFLFGILTAALSTPCTFGSFLALLVWAIKQPAWLGGSALVMVGVGMASPYFILSAFPEVARKFPRTGPWPEVVKQFMAFLLLATAIYFAQPLLAYVSTHAVWWAMFASIAGGGLFLIIRAIQLSPRFTPRAIALVIAAVIVVPAFLVVRRITFEPFKWIPYSDSALATAMAAGHPVVIDFTAAWCGNCHYLEANVLYSHQVVSAVDENHVTMLQADVTNKGAPARPLLDKLNASGAGAIPLTAVYFPNREEPTLLKGIYSADDLVKTLTQ